MDNQLANMLAECLDWIDREGGTVGQAASRYPKHQEELIEILETIEQINKHTVVVPRPEFQAAAKKRMKNLIHARQKAVTADQNVTFSRPIRHKRRNTQNTGLRRLSMSWLIVLITAASLLLGGGGVAYASTDALPGDGLYPVKTLVQDVELALSGDEGDIDLLVGFLSENIDEMNQLADQGRWDDLEAGLGQYQENLDALAQTRSRVSYLDAPSEEALNTRLQQELHTHSEELLKAADKASSARQIADSRKTTR